MTAVSIQCSKSTGEDARGYEFPHSDEPRQTAAKKRAQRVNSRRRTHGGEEEEEEMERIMMKTMSGEMMRGADERRDDDADGDETKVAVWGNKRQRRGAERREVYDGFLQRNCSGSPSQ